MHDAYLILVITILKVKHFILLFQALVNNPHTSPRLLEHIVDRCMAGDGRLESFINVRPASVDCL